MRPISAIPTVLALALTACVAEPPPPDGEQVTSYVDHREIPVTMNTKIDLLFVIDSSPAMAAAQTKLVADYRRMIDVLAQSTFGELPDVHIGVVTADLADQGTLHHAAFLADAPRFAWRRERNYYGSLGDAFVDLAAVGTSGSSHTAPLEAMLRALSPAVNPGFVRDAAFLEVVFLTTGDDQGTEGVVEVAHALKTLKQDPSKVVVNGAFGACSGNGITGADAPRLASFLDQFPNRSSRATLCDDDLAPVVIVQRLLTYLLGIACFEHVHTPHECAAYLVDPDSDEQVLLPECSSPTASRCWTLGVNDYGACEPGGQGLLFHPSAFPFSATAMIDCVAEAP
jgi:hypothetical protein